MKKIYLLLFSLLPIASFAGTKDLSRCGIIDVESRATAETIVKNDGGMLNGFTSYTLQKVAGESLQGQWNFSFGDYYFSDSTGGTINVVYNASLNDQGELEFEDVEEYRLPFIATYDESTSKLTFVKAFIGEVKDGNRTRYVYQQPFHFDYDIYDMIETDELVGTFNASNNLLSFEKDNGLQWIMYMDKAGTIVISNGYIDIQDFESAVKLSNSEDGVENVFLESDSPVEYFNLQGIKLAEPTKGEIIIVKKGNQVQRVLF